MKKRFILFMLLLLVIGVIPAAWSAAAPAETLTALSRYFPEDTPIFAALRTDEDYVKQLDSIVQRASAFGLIPYGTTLSGALDEIQLGPGGKTYTMLRPFLGDTAAVGLIGPVSDWMRSPNPPAVIVIQITDRKAAEAFLDELLLSQMPRGMFEKSTEGDYTLYKTDERTASSVAVNNEVVIMTYSADLLGKMPEKPLSASASFKAALAELPADDYNIIAYIDGAGINQAMMSMMATTSPQGMMGMEDFMKAAAAAQGQQMVGLTLLDGRALTMDLVAVPGDTTAFEQMGFKMDFKAPPVDLAFAANIPAETPLVIQGTALGPTTLNGFEALRDASAFLQKQMQGMMDQMMSGMGGRTDLGMKFVLDSFRVSDILVLVDYGFAGMTGLNLEREVLSWMDGDYAMYLRVLPLANAETTGLPITLDGALITETNNPDATRYVMDSLNDAMTAYDAVFIRETSDNMDTLALTNLIRSLFPAEMKEKLKDETAFDFLVGFNGTVFGVGTRPAVEFSMNPTENSLATDPAFESEKAFFLPDTSTLWYLNLRPFRALAEQMIPGADDLRADQMPAPLALLQFFDGGSITGMTTEKAAVARLVLTLSDVTPPPPPPPTPTPRPTATPIPTNTPTLTNTPVPPTSTPLPTSTPVPPTNTAAPTNTSRPPSSTPLPTNTAAAEATAEATASR